MPEPSAGAAPSASRAGLVVQLFRSEELTQVLTMVGVLLAAAAFELQQLLGWSGYLAALIGCLGLMAGSFAARREEVRWRTLMPVSLIVFLAWVVASLVWSSYQWATLGGIGYLLAFTLMAMWVAVSRDTIQIVRAVGDMLRIVLGASLFIEVFAGILIDSPLPFLGVHGYLGTFGPINGIEPSRDQLGLVAIIGAITFATEHRTHSVTRLRSVLSLVLAGICIVLTQSAVVIIAAIVVGIAAAVIYAIRRASPESRRLWQFGALGLAIVGVVLIGVFRSPLIHLFNVSGVLDFRIALWRQVLSVASVDGLQGWGWVGPWRTEIEPFLSLSSSPARPVDSALNAFFDVGLQLGVIGVVIFIGMVGLAFTRSWLLAGSRSSVVYAWPAASLVALIIISLAESSILTDFGWMTFVICCMKASEELSWRSALRAE